MEGTTNVAAQIARGGARSLLFRALTAVSDFLVILVTARGFGAEGRGLYALASLTALILVTVFGGTVVGLAAEVAHERVTVAFLNTISVMLAVGASALVMVTVTAARVLGWPDEPALLLGIAITPVLLLTELQIGLYQALGNVRRMHWIQLAKSLLTAACFAAVGLVAPGRIYLAFGVWIVAQTLLPLVIVVLQSREARFIWTSFSAPVLRIVRRGSYASLANGIMLLNYRIDLVVVAALLSSAELGRYSVAIATGEALWLLSRALLTGAFAPIISSAREESAWVTLRVVRHTWPLMLLGGLLLTVFIWLLGGEIFGPAFDDIWVPLVILLPGLIAFGMIEVLRTFFLIRLEQSHQVLLLAVGGTVATLVMALAFVPWMGIAGAALATTISYVLGSLYLLVEFSRHVGVSTAREFLPGRSEVADYGVFAQLVGRWGRASFGH